MTNQYNYQPMGNQFYQLYPQPQGIVYFINSSNDLSTVPISNATASIFCLPEDLCYIRTIQGGVPNIVSYKLIPVTDNEKKEKEEDILEIVKRLEERIKNLETPEKKGGKINEFI